MDNDNKYGLKNSQEKLLEMIKIIDQKFSEKGLFYIFIYGSALGAIREKGFIPWDDDIDIAILREDTGLAESALDELDYYYETGEKHMRPSAPIMHVSSVHRNSITPDFNIKDYPEIDIWIIDRVPKSRIKKKIARFTGLAHDFFTYRQAPATRGNAVSKVASFFINHLSGSRMDILQKRTLDFLIKLGKGEKYVTEAYFLKHFRVYERDFLTNSIRVPFEDMLAPVPKSYDEYLTVVYGDYMTPPPEKPVDSGQEKTKKNKRNRGTAITYDARIPDHHS